MVLAHVCSNGTVYTGDRCGCPPCRASRYRDNERRNEKARAHGRTSKTWKRYRLRVLRDAGHQCQIRLPGCTERATTVHIPPGMGGDHIEAARLDAGTAACRHCHGVVDAPRARRAG